MTIHFTLSSSDTSGAQVGLHLLPVQPIHGVATEQFSTSLAMELYRPVGALDDFAISDAGQPDAIRSRMATSFGPTDSVWVRPYSLFQQPVDYPRTLDPLNDLNSTYMWKRARYIAAGFKWAGVLSTGAHYLDKVQYEPMGGYTNLLGFDASTLEGSTCPYRGYAAGNSLAAISSARAYSGSHSLKVTCIAANTATSFRPVPITGFIAASGNTVYAQARVSSNFAGSFQLTAHYYATDLTEISAQSTGTTAHPGDGSWLLFSVTASAFNIPPTAAWIGITLDRTNVNGAGDVYYVDDLRIWTNANASPSPYVPPRKTILNIQADRINRVRNGSFIGSSRGWQAFGSASPTITTDNTTGLSSSNSLRVNVPYYTGGIVGQPWFGVQSRNTNEDTPNSNISGLVPGNNYVASAWIKRAPGCPNVYTNIARDNDVVNGHDYNTVLNTNTTDPNYIQGAWVRVWTTFQVLQGETGEVRLQAFIKSAEQIPSVSGIFWMTDVLVEEGTVPSDTFFDGSFGGYDYLWEGTAGWSRTHYYQDRRQKSFRLNDIVTQALPVGGQFEIRYATFVDRPNDLPSDIEQTVLGDRLGTPSLADANVTNFIKQHY